MDKGQVVASGLIVACRHASALLDGRPVSFRQVSLFVKDTVVFHTCLAASQGRNDRFSLERFDMSPHTIAVVTFVSNDGARLMRGEQRACVRDICFLPCRQFQFDGVTAGVDGNM